jgi:protein tyrosine/serine phosphatase
MRWIALDGAVNARDLGGLPTTDGALTLPKRLLRADNLQGLSGPDVYRLVQEFNLTRVIDLRSVAEVDSEGPGPLSAIEAVDHVHHSVIPVEDRITSTAAVRDVLLARQKRLTSTDPDEIISGHYLGYLEDRPDSVVGALRAITETPGAALVHCAAGKDRTGVIVALALLAVGVQRGAVVADYVATGSRIEAILARLRASVTYAGEVDRISTEQHTPRASAMERFLGLIDSEHGGAIRWLANQGFGPGDVHLLRQKLVQG